MRGFEKLERKIVFVFKLCFIYKEHSGKRAKSTTMAVAEDRGVLNLPGSSAHVSVSGWYLRMASERVEASWNPPTTRKLSS